MSAVTLFILLLASMSLTALVRKLALSSRWLDIPNARSSHEQPVPKGGGIAIVICFLSAVLILVTVGRLPRQEGLALGTASVIAVLGFLDDCWNLSIATRLSVQFACALLALILLGALPFFSVPGMRLEGGWSYLAYLLGALGVIWILNLVNFMDGIDGITGAETLFLCSAVILFALEAGQEDDALLLAALGVSVLGFLVWNLPPAKIFMGDVGSTFLGFVLALLAVLSISHGYMSLWTWLLLGGVYVTDTAVTLVKRMICGEIWYHAHREHAYQHAAVRFGSHGKTVAGVMLINVGWLLPLAWLSRLVSQWAWLLTMLGLLPLILLALKFKAGTRLR